MRWFHLAVIALFAIATIIFATQNRELVTMSFLGFNARAPLALLVGIIYVLGMVTGGSLWALLRRSFHGSQIVRSQ
jgi:putative membrane protein